MTEIHELPEETPPAARPRRSGISRRQFLPRAAGAVAALGVAGASGYEISQRGAVVVDNPEANLSAQTRETDARLGPAPGTPGSGMQRFVTRPDLLPPLIDFNQLGGAVPADASPRFIVLAPMSNVAYAGLQRGPMMIDRRGRLVWFEPIDGSVFDVNVQSYHGRPTFTWWQGEVTDGHGIGTAIVADHNYRTVASVASRDAMPIDLHEFNLTSRGTALLSSYQQATADLSAVNGPVNGQVFAGHALEIDVATGKVLLDWNSLDHVGIEESYEPYAGAKTTYDYFHINSIAEAQDGNLLISGRHTWCVYKVDRTTGEVLWRLNGKRSDFRVEPAAAFSWQHHVRAHGESGLTLFDNAIGSGHGSLALVLTLDSRRKRVTLDHAYQHPAKFSAVSLGSVQLLPGGQVFVGWGIQPYFSEFARDGRMLMTAQFESSMRSYRTFLVDWVGHPTEPPAVVATTNPAGGFIVYASWNGATEIDHWTVLAGPNASSLRAVGSQPWSGFETAIAVNSTGPCFVAVANDRNGNELGRSKVA